VKTTKRARLQGIVSCKSCKFYHGYRLWEGRKAGHCKRHAPSPWVGHYQWLREDQGMRAGIGVVQPVWPQVFETDWCGDYVHKETNATGQTPAAQEKLHDV
jgi:hypothetical protein